MDIKNQRFRLIMLHSLVDALTFEKILLASFMRKKQVSPQRHWTVRRLHVVTQLDVTV
jgi:hypothetical protein